MNPNTSLRLAKEARALLPMWSAVAVWITAPFLLPVNDPLPYAFTGFLFGCAVLGPVCVGHEFTHRTMDFLLTQPVPRRQLWREKLAVTGLALLGLSLLLVFAILLRSTTGLAEVIRHAAEDDPLRVALFVTVPVIVPIMGFCTGPSFALFARNSLGGAALVFIIPFFFMVAGIIMTKGLTDFAPAVEERILLSYALLVGAVYSGVMFLDGCRRFERFEDANMPAQEFAAPQQFAKLFSGLAKPLAPARHGSTLNLLRKELRLQQPAFLVAAFLVVLWVVFSGVWHIRPSVGGEVMLVPAIFLGLGIPVTVGIVSTAEERRLGVHDWHLTLPVSARRQWCVKVLVALGVNSALGILLPGLLAHASSWLANNPQLVAEIPGNNVPPFLIGNLVLVVAALYASSAASNGLRALIGTIVLFLAGAMVLNLSDYAVSSIAKLATVNQFHAEGRVSYHHTSGLIDIVHRHRWLLGWSCLTMWLYFLGFAGFRRSLESFWQPARRMAVFFVVVCAFVFAAIVW